MLYFSVLYKEKIIPEKSGEAIFFNIKFKTETVKNEKKLKINILSL